MSPIHYTTLFLFSTTHTRRLTLISYTSRSHVPRVTPMFALTWIFGFPLVRFTTTLVAPFMYLST
jgi:hypothetical protein